MSFSLFLSLLFLLPFPSLSDRHVITVSSPSASLRPSTLAWDPVSSHFIAGSAASLLSISDAGVTSLLVSSDGGSAVAGSVAGVAVDSVRRRLIVAYSNPNSVAAFHLKSHERIFEAELGGEPAGAALDLAGGEVFVSGAERAVVWKVELDGKVRVFSEFEKYGKEGLGGIVHVSRGYLLVSQPSTGKLFKVDSEDGAIKEVLSTSGTNQLAPSVRSLSLFHDLTLLIASNQTLSLLKSHDSWAQAGTQEKIKLENNERVAAVAVREGNVGYVMVEGENGEVRIEEIEWGKEREDIVWGLVLLGLGFAYFCVWRFQMGRLVSGMNKKRN